ncbi:EF-hand domain-containing protein [Mesorhizobium sp.]|uniref:EF-hand domain-containing protein n=1 Tax=Mesorhizobium sp. TaxID=1871066 RepID=UPI000FE5B5A3|nr:EF-hand domain-containing protein [Mesorhizobium sp.]RWK43624.1 MAG: EF-hand domain-containing protein [Mesorhizobium sp.]RWK68522.1 MAG: EF-hand domain-containing protein [Mesorhizobium sp.]RWK77313.1 MAG: EF-hand domain-containing protein [Mesorhizobium sp.]RWK79559.1 MAG: EF-hand domain-containing protein [Mesorhizobium sp.]RWL03582.1 MAG: EF-hand domain-containing protein [Mesorhizobium sp.]
MTLIALMRAAALAATVAAGATATAAAQTTAADPHDTTVAQAAPSPEPGGMAGQDQGAQPAQPGMMPPGMMGQGMMGQGMGQGMMGEMMQPGMMGAMPMMRMRGHMMKIMFAIADTDGDSALSFEEITAIHKRIFDRVDANRDGKVTTEEVQAFMRE